MLFLAALKKNMNMIAREGPGIDCALPFDDRLPKSFQKTGTVLVILKDGGFVNAPHHYYDVWRRQYLNYLDEA